MIKGGEMKKGYGVMLLTLFSMLSVVFFWGCGGSGPGAPGSSGSADTGIVVRVDSVTHTDITGDRGDTWQIDLVQDLCEGGEAEPWGDDLALVTFNGQEINNSVINNELFVTNYKVTFLKVNPNLPTIEQMSFSSQTGIFVLPGAPTGPFPFLFFDFGRKLKIQNDINTGLNQVSTPLLYNMKIEMWGQDKFGNSVTFPPIERAIEIADYNNC